MCRVQSFIVTFSLQEPKFGDETVSFPCMSRRSSTFLMKIQEQQFMNSILPKPGAPCSMSEWPRGGAVSWCRWQCNICRAHCSPLNLWLFGSFTQIIVPVHKTWFMEAYWRSELYPIVQHLLILLSQSRHDTWGLFIIDGSTNVASGLEN